MVIKSLRLFLFLWLVVLMTGNVILTPQDKSYSTPLLDEVVWGEVAQNTARDGLDGMIESRDNKPLAFLTVEYLAGAGDGVTGTRILNFIIVLVIAGLIYIYTKNPLSGFYVIIPYYLFSHNLTVEIFESLFLVLCLLYPERKGLMLGFAGLFRPYSIIFSPAILRKEKRQWLIYAGVGVGYVLFLLYVGGLWSYLDTVINYAGYSPQGIDVMAIMGLIPFALLSLKNRELFMLGLIACIPTLLLRPGWGHYYITPYTMFFIGYLKK